MYVSMCMCTGLPRLSGSLTSALPSWSVARAASEA